MACTALTIRCWAGDRAGPLLGGRTGGVTWFPTKPVSARICLGGAAFPACDSVGKRSSLGERTWVPNNVELSSSLGVDVVDPYVELSSSLGVDVVDPWVSKFGVLEFPPVVRAVSKFLWLVICAYVLFST